MPMITYGSRLPCPREGGSGLQTAAGVCGSRAWTCEGAGWTGGVRSTWGCSGENREGANHLAPSLYLLCGLPYGPIIIWIWICLAIGPSSLSGWMPPNGTMSVWWIR